MSALVIEREDQVYDKATICPRGMLTSAVTVLCSLVTDKKQKARIPTFGTLETLGNADRTLNEPSSSAQMHIRRLFR